MFGSLRAASIESIMVSAFMIYLLGAATPIVLLRSVANDRQDTCFLSAMLWAIVLVFGGLTISLMV